MRVARVIGTVVSSLKDERLEGLKLLVIDELDPRTNQPLNSAAEVAVDTVGAGEGDTVLVTHGSPAARVVVGEAPIDAAIVGIVDRISTKSRMKK